MGRLALMGCQKHMFNDDHLFWNSHLFMLRGSIEKVAPLSLKATKRGYPFRNEGEQPQSRKLALCDVQKTTSH
jgi:hypothetical protein